MKKLSVLLALVLLCGAFSVFTFAADPATVSIGNATVTAGGQVTVNVTMKNAPAMVGAQLSIGYDANALSFVSAKSLDNRFSFYSSTEQSANPVKLVMAKLDFVEVSGDIQVAEVTFKAANNVADGSYTLSLAVEEAYNKNIEAVSMTAQNGVITVGNPVVTTEAPVVTTAAPVETTAAPVVTTVAPVVTTAAPVVTTAAPVVTTAAPVVTTAVPVVTADAPVVTTAAPVETTVAPVVTTAAPTAPAEDDGAPIGLIVGIVAAVVVAVIAFVVLKKKK